MDDRWIPDTIPVMPELEESLPRLPVPLEEVAEGGPVFLTGQMRSGKSYVAKHLDRRETVKLSTPMWAVAEFFFGENLSKDQPGIRSLMQEIGRLGRGDFGEDFRPTPSRASFIQSVRDHGQEIIQNLLDQGEWFRHRHEYYNINWSRFGKSEDFWLDILCGRVEARRLAHEHGSQYDKAPAVPDVRYPNTVERLLDRGFHHVHVSASLQERVTRGAPAESEDRTERLGKELDRLWKHPSLGPSGMMAEEVAERCPKAAQRVASGASVVWSDPEHDCPGELTRAEDLIRLSKIYPSYAPITA